MADLLTRPLLRRDEPAWGSRVPWLAAIVAAAWALVAGLAICVLPGVAVWIGEGAVAPLGDPLRLGARLWLSAHRVGLDAGGADITFAPLGLTLVILLLLHRCARWAAHSAGVATTRGAVTVVVPATLVYGLGAGAVAGFATTPDLTVLPLAAVLWAAGWSGAAVTLGTAHESGLLMGSLVRLPRYARAGVAGAVAAVAGLIVVGAGLTALSAVLNTDRVGALASALDAGLLGGTVLALACAAIVPNAIVWSTAFALGPGFAVGTGTSVAPDGVTLGLVPAVPALGALPADLPGAVAWLVVAGPLLAGAVTGLVVHRWMDDDDLWPAVGVTGGAGAVAAVAMAVLALLSGGSAGAERLTQIGPVPWEMAAATLAFISVPAALVVVVLRLRRVAPAQDPEAEPAPDGDPVPERDLGGDPEPETALGGDPEPETALDPAPTGDPDPEPGGPPETAPEADPGQPPPPPSPR
ncbi:DUF6350 family protein [Jiangella gansuensis]|uniref:cell division protein PerM n=1 Tax=Jiangella gansuensis TaxID=281473 RepID=UPI00047B619F|nr:DUF6350 family protein [Jiangella gansuensis]